jgi:chorismate dehydratase
MINHNCNINSSRRLSLRAKINQLMKIRVGAVSYLNTKPLLYGIKRHVLMNEIELIEDYPSKIAQMLIDNEIDIGLIPVASILRLNEWHIDSDYCIASNGAVASVCIFSEVPMELIDRVYLDYQSRTSVNLAKILLKEYWHKEVELIDASGEDFRELIIANNAAVIIGDRALEQRKKSRFIYDLGQAWKNHTGLPFVFAAWIANKRLPASFISAFNDANGFGLERITEVIQENESPHFDLRKYYTCCIEYILDEDKRKGLELFLYKLKMTKV